MRCPSDRGCMVSINVINHNRTSDTSCSNINGKYKLCTFWYTEKNFYAYINIYICIMYTYINKYVCTKQHLESLSSHSHSPGTAFTVMMEAAISPEMMIIHHLTRCHIQEFFLLHFIALLILSWNWINFSTMIMIIVLLTIQILVASSPTRCHNSTLCPHMYIIHVSCDSSNK